MKDKILLGKRIKYYRTLKDWTQEELADELDMGLPTISKIERGVIDMPFTRLCKMAKVLGVSLPELVNIHSAKQ